MSKRFNLPYTTQDLFPQAPTTASPSMRSGSVPVTGSSGDPNSRGSSLRNGPGSYSGSSFIPSGPNPSGSIASRAKPSIQSVKKMLRRLFKPNTLDFESAMWDIFHLIVNPRKMYRSQYYYKQHQTSGKNNYARDDPSFLILLTIFLCISAIAWGLAYSPHIVDILKLIVYMVFIDFYLTGIMISTVSWLVTNKIFNNTWGLGNLNKYNINYIEWGFCFDIHCNSFLIIWCLLYLVQFILLPLITIKNSFLSLLLGNTLYLVAVGYYFVITFYGFNSLPFVNTQSINPKPSTESPAKLLQMIIIAGILPLLGLIWILSLCLRFNVAYTMIDTYFN